MAGKLLSIFKQIEDKRRDLSKLHDLNDILAMAILAVICGADTWDNIEEYCEAKEEWLAGFLNLENGIPSHDTFNRVISSIDSQHFERCFIEWVSELIKVTDVREIVNIDGKTIRGAKEHGKKSPVHMVSAWAHQNNLVLGQVKVTEKSNEITAPAATPAAIKVRTRKSDPLKTNHKKRSSSRSSSDRDNLFCRLST